MSDTSTSTWPAMTDAMRKTQAYIKLHGKATSTDIAALHGITVDAAGKQLKRMAERGIVHRQADGRWVA